MGAPAQQGVLLLPDCVRPLTEGFRRQLPQLLHGGHAQVSHQFLRDLPGLLFSGGFVEGLDAASALQDGSPHHSLGEGRGDDGLNAHAAGGLACQGDLVRVASEGGNVLPHPLQGEDLVQDAVVAGHTLGVFPFQIRVGEEAEHVHPVVDGHQHHAFFGAAFPVELLLRAAAVHERPAVDPEQHRQLGAGFSVCRGPDVQVQAVLVPRRNHHVVKFFPVKLHGGKLRLGAPGGESGAVQRGGPGGVLLGTAEPQFPHRGLGVGHALEHNRVPVRAQAAPDGSLFGGDAGIHVVSSFRNKLLKAGRWKAVPGGRRESSAAGTPLPGRCRLSPGRARRSGGPRFSGGECESACGAPTAGRFCRWR